MVLLVVKLPKLFNPIINIVEFELANLCFLLWQDYGSSHNILQADLSNISLISKKAVQKNPKLIIEEGWTLITRSGTIGRMAYCRSDMAGMACNKDVLRVVADPDKILSGYLYAYLSSKFGVPLVISGTYGAIIQHIETR